jgi:hypothetical protein
MTLERPTVTLDSHIEDTYTPCSSDRRAVLQTVTKLISGSGYEGTAAETQLINWQQRVLDRYGARRHQFYSACNAWDNKPN